MKRAVCYPTIEIKGETIPVYGFTTERRDLLPVGNHARYDKAVSKHGTQSPNFVRAIRIGTDAVIKTMFDGTEVRGSFGFEGSRKIDELTAQVKTKEREAVPRLLSCMLHPKMNNLEELYIDKQILIIAGMNVGALEEMNNAALVKAVKNSHFTLKLLGVEDELIRVFPRLATVVLGNRTITVNMFKGNWEVVGQNEETENKGQLRIANRHWMVEEKTYLKDEQLYRYVMEYNKKNFGQ